MTLRASGISRRCDVMRATGICDCTGIVVVTAPGKPAAKFAGGMSRWPKIRVWFCVSDNGGVRVMGRLEFSGSATCWRRRVCRIAAELSLVGRYWRAGRKVTYRARRASQIRRWVCMNPCCGATVKPGAK